MFTKHIYDENKLFVGGEVGKLASLVDSIAVSNDEQIRTLVDKCRGK